MWDGVGDPLEPKSILDLSVFASCLDADREEGMCRQVSAELGEETALIFRAQREEEAGVLPEQPVAEERSAKDRVLLVAKTRQFDEFFFGGRSLTFHPESDPPETAIEKPRVDGFNV